MVSEFRTQAKSVPTYDLFLSNSSRDLTKWAGWSGLLCIMSAKTKTAPVLRFESFQLDSFTIEAESGFLRADAKLTRVGIFEYAHTDGSSHKELRLPEEVFDPESMRSFELVPLVDNHPTINDGKVTAENARFLSRGTVANIRRQGDYLIGTVCVTDADMIRSIQGGKRELSCGYFQQREPAPPGSKFRDPVTGDDQEYQFIQRNIRGNHVAVVAHGRAGPDARIMLDSNDNQIPISGLTPKDKTNMEKITVDGYEFEVSTQAAKAFRKVEAQHADALKALGTKLSQTEARADAAEIKAKNLEAEIKAANDPAKFDAAVTERAALNATAKANGIEPKGSNHEIKVAVLGKLAPEVRCDGKGSDYVNAIFDLVTAQKTAQNPIAVRLDAAAKGGPSTPVPANKAERVKAHNAALYADDRSQKINA